MFKRHRAPFTHYCITKHHSPLQSDGCVCVCVTTAPHTRTPTNQQDKSVKILNETVFRKHFSQSASYSCRLSDASVHCSAFASYRNRCVRRYHRSTQFELPSSRIIGSALWLFRSALQLARNVCMRQLPAFDGMLRIVVCAWCENSLSARFQGGSADIPSAVCFLQQPLRRSAQSQSFIRTRPGFSQKRARAHARAHTAQADTRVIAE